MQSKSPPRLGKTKTGTLRSRDIFLIKIVALLTQEATQWNRGEEGVDGKQGSLPCSGDTRHGSRFCYWGHYLITYMVNPLSASNSDIQEKLSLMSHQNMTSAQINFLQFGCC
ncbi:hypothetical protein ACE6H2_002271 [Prunus campanulata]